jgi:hypothetical protein
MLQLQELSRPGPCFLSALELQQALVHASSILLQFGQAVPRLLLLSSHAQANALENFLLHLPMLSNPQLLVRLLQDGSRSLSSGSNALLCFRLLLKVRQRLLGHQPCGAAQLRAIDETLAVYQGSISPAERQQLLTLKEPSVGRLAGEAVDVSPVREAISRKRTLSDASMEASESVQEHETRAVLSQELPAVISQELGAPASQAVDAIAEAVARPATLAPAVDDRTRELADRLGRLALQMDMPDSASFAPLALTISQCLQLGQALALAFSASKMPLSDESALVAVCLAYVQLSPPPGFNSTCTLMEHLLLPWVSALSKPASRAFAGLLLEAAQRFPRATIKHLCVPVVLHQGGFGAAQLDLLRRMLQLWASTAESGPFASELLRELLQARQQRGMSSPWSDHLLELMTAVLEASPPPLPEPLASSLVAQLSGAVLIGSASIPAASQSASKDVSEPHPTASRGLKLSNVLRVLTTRHLCKGGPEMLPAALAAQQLLQVIDHFIAKSMLTKLSAQIRVWRGA